MANSVYLVQNQTSLSDMSTAIGLIEKPIRIYLMAALVRILYLASNK